MTPVHSVNLNVRKGIPPGWAGYDAPEIAYAKLEHGPDPCPHCKRIAATTQLVDRKPHCVNCGRVR